MADQRIQYTEEMVGAGHPTKADTINRLPLVSHNADGTPKLLACRVHNNGVDQTINASTETLVQWSTADFDPLGWANFTNERITPTIAGKYFAHAQISMRDVADGKWVDVRIKKNGTAAIERRVIPGGALNALEYSASGVVTLNGSTDYIEVTIHHNDTVSRSTNAAIVNHFVELFYLGV